MTKMITRMTLCAVALASLTTSAHALAPFKKSFQKKYVAPSDNADLAAAFKKASCNTCHVKGKKKTERNAYGDELAKLIEGDANKRIKAARKAGGAQAGKDEQKKVLAELEKAFDEVAKLPSGDEKPTYGELLKQHQLPVPLDN